MPVSGKVPPITICVFVTPGVAADDEANFVIVDALWALTAAATANAASNKNLLLMLLQSRQQDGQFRLASTIVTGRTTRFKSPATPPGITKTIRISTIPNT